MSFSIIVPTKNEELLLPKLLESIKNQTIQPLEIIVSDAGSHDQTIEIAKRFNCTITKGGPPARGRNVGARKSLADILVFFDADCYIKNKNLLKITMDTFVKKDLDIASGFAISSKNNNLFGHLAIYGSDIRKILDLIASRLFKNTLGGSGWYLVVKRNVFEKMRGFDESFINYEDTDFIKRTIKSGYRYGLIPCAIVLSGRRYNKMSFSKALKIILHLTLFKTGWSKKENLKHYENLKGPLGGS